MDTARWDELETLFEKVHALPPEQRASFLSQCCRHDPGLQAELFSLLDAYQEAPGFFAEMGEVVRDAFRLAETPEGHGTSGTDKRIGSVVGSYRILERLGEGGMGVVYKAEDLRLGRIVALKFLPAHLDADERARARFMQEARAASALDDTNVATVYDFEETEDGQRYIVMPFYAGDTLKTLIARGARPVAEALSYAAQIARGLAKTHAHGIVHRDIKPANVIVTPEGLVKVVDFGLAKLADQHLTITGTTMGTVAYMSPEQARGEAVDHRTDIWSLGVVLYEMLTGELPFRGEHEQVTLYAIINEPPRPLLAQRGDLPWALQAIVNCCLQKDPDQRYQTADALLVDLEQAQADVAAGRRRYWPGWRKARLLGLGRRPRRLAWGAAAVLLVSLILSAPAVREGRLGGQPQPSVPAEKHLVVLPFVNIGGDARNQAFGEGLVETVTSKLTQLEPFQQSLWVVPSSEVHDVHSVGEARRLFGVNLAVTGSVQQDSGAVRLTLNLVDAVSKRQLSSDVITERMATVAALEGRVIGALADMLRLEVQPQAQAVLSAGGTTVPDAFAFFQQGSGYLQRYQSADNIEIAIDLFKQALEEDSTYASAYAGLGEAYWRMYGAAQDERWVARAVESCVRALALDDRLATAHATLGLIYTGTGRTEEAVLQLQHALALEPASAETYRKLAHVYEDQGRVDEAEAAYVKAVELKPSYWAGYNDLGAFYYRQGAYEKAANQFRQVVNLTPDNAWGYINLGALYTLMEKWDEARTMFERSIEIEPTFDAYSNLGTLAFYHDAQYAEAVQRYEKAVELEDQHYDVWGNLAAAYYYGFPDQPEKARAHYRHAIQLAEKQLQVNPRDPVVLCDLASYQASLGEGEAARALLAQTLGLASDDVNVMFCAGDTYETLGDRERALQWIGRALDRGYSRALIEQAPGLKALRADPRFQRLLTP